MEISQINSKEFNLLEEPSAEKEWFTMEKAYTIK